MFEKVPREYLVRRCIDFIVQEVLFSYKDTRVRLQLNLLFFMFSGKFFVCLGQLESYLLVFFCYLLVFFCNMVRCFILYPYKVHHKFCLPERSLSFIFRSSFSLFSISHSRHGAITATT